MPAHDLTDEERRKGGYNSGAVRRERGKSVRQRIAEKLEDEADAVVKVYMDAIAATREHAPDHDIRLKAVREAMDQAFGKPAQSVKVSGDEGEPPVQFEDRSASLHDVAAVLRAVGALPPDGSTAAGE